MTDTTDTTVTEAVSAVPNADETPVKVETKDESTIEQSAETTTETVPGAAAEETKEGETTAENGTGEEAEGADALPKLFVGRLPLGTKDAQLKELFTPFGEVTHCDIVGKYGFVHMKSKEEADKAMTSLNNHSFNGSNITVQLSTSTAKKTKKRTNRQNVGVKKNANGGNRRSTNNVKNGFVQKSKNLINNSNNNNANATRNKSNNADNSKNTSNNNANTPNQQNRQNGNANNKMRGRRNFNNNNRMNRPPMMYPQLTPMQGPGFYNNNQPPMNNYYQQPPMAVPQMQPVGPPRDMYYNNRPANNGQYYGSNAPASPQMYSGMNMQPPMQHQPQQPNYYQQPPIQQQPPLQQTYNRGPIGQINKMSPMPSQPVPQQPMYQSSYGNMSTSTSPLVSGGYQNYGGYGNGQQMLNNSSTNVPGATNNFPNRNGFANKGRGNNNRFNNNFNNRANNNKRIKQN